MMEKNMKKLSLQGFRLISENKRPEDKKVFNEDMYVFVGEEGSNAIGTYFLKIVGSQWIDEVSPETDPEPYLKQSLILEEYDEGKIKEYLEGLLEQCNKQKDESSWFYLARYMKYEDEELAMKQGAQ